MKAYAPLFYVGLILLNLLAAKIAFVPSLFVAPTKWEYRIESVPDATFQETMREIGGEGWEMVSARRASNGAADLSESKFAYEVIFKRPITALDTDATTGTETRGSAGNGNGNH